MEVLQQKQRIEDETMEPQTDVEATTVTLAPDGGVRGVKARAAERAAERELMVNYDDVCMLGGVLESKIGALKRKRSDEEQANKPPAA